LISICQKERSGLDREAMAVNRRQVNPNSLANEISPIQYITENGFSIIRVSDVDKSFVDTPSKCRFLVRNERGWEREVTVHFDEKLISQIQIRRRIPLSKTSVLWLVCAEQCLATYLWENNDYPDNGQLSISELPLDELLLATHWTDQRDDNEPFV
jgi:hypothetical protein